MPREAKSLSARAVNALQLPPGRGKIVHRVGGAPGLMLLIKKTGARSWILRNSIDGKVTDIGLGRYAFDKDDDGVTLAEARALAIDERRKIRGGGNPVAERKAVKAELAAAAAVAKAETAKAVTFKDARKTYIASHESSWKSPKHAAQWTATLETYADPILGGLPVALIETAHVLDVLRPIWTKTPETATRVRGRIEAILDAAKAEGRIPSPWENPARWRGHLDKLLPARARVAPVEHFSALPYARAGAFMVDLRTREGMGARALELAILTASRSGMVRGATWAEFDLAAKVWTVPAARMKGLRGKSQEHRVPLSQPALDMLEALPRIAGTDLVFPASRGGQLSDATMAAVIDRMNEGAGGPAWVDKDGTPVVPHGFRSTFRDWAGERTNFPRELAEQALAHVLKDKTEAAYARGDALEKRRKLMAAWGNYLTRVEEQKPANVVQFQVA